MEGQTRPSNKLRFVESKKKIKVEGQIGQPYQKLITAANLINHNLTLIGLADSTLRCVETSQLLDFNSNQPQVINQSLDIFATLSFRPTLISVARYGYSSVLLVCGTSNFPRCPMVEVYDLDTRTVIGKQSLGDLGESEIIDYAWHPSYYDSIVALCTSRGQLLVLAINKKDRGIGIVYKNEQYGALTCCWSMKGKNLAVGTQRGTMFRLEPVVGNNSFSFKEVNGSNITFENPKITPVHQLVRLRWVNQKYLIATHAKPAPSMPDTVYSIITVKPGKPYLYWTNVSFEGQSPSNYVVHLANLSNSVVCATTATGEAAVIGVLGANEVATNDLNDWSALIVEEEGARIELPLDANNSETHPCGLTMTTWSQDNRPVLIFYTSDGLICPYAAMHADNILKFPEHIHQPEQVFSFEVPKLPAPSALSFSSLTSTFQSSHLSPSSAFGGPPTFGGAATFSGAPTPVSSATLGGTPAFGGAATFGGTPSFFQTSALKPPTMTAFQTSQPVSQPSNIQSQPLNLQAKPLTQAQPTQLAQSTLQAQSPQSPQPIGSVFGQPDRLLPTTSQLDLQKSLPTIRSPNTLAQSQSQQSTPVNKSLQLSQTSDQQATPNQTTPQLTPSILSSQQLAQSTPVTQQSGNQLQAKQQLSLTPSQPLSFASPSSTQQQSLNLNLLPKVQQATQLQVRSQPQQLATLQQKTTTEPTEDLDQLTHFRVDDSLLTTTRDKIQQAREKLDYNEAYITLFEELNHLRDRFDETLDLHRSHREALDAIKNDIDGLDLEVLETFYLIEYVKSRISCDIKKKTIDPVTLKKVTNIKVKLKHLEGKLDELNDHVDVAWEDFVRRRSNKERRVSSLDMIYKALANNQKLINVLKKRAEFDLDKSLNNSTFTIDKMPTVKPRECDHSRFEEFLASRSVVPVRKPVHLK